MKVACDYTKRPEVTAAPPVVAGAGRGLPAAGSADSLPQPSSSADVECAERAQDLRRRPDRRSANPRQEAPRLGIARA
jgi:hypothetical protein